MKKILTFLAACAVSLSAFASAPDRTSSIQGSGLVGTSYVETGFTYLDTVSGLAVLSGNATLNQPISREFDLKLNYEYTWVQADQQMHEHSLTAGILAYVGDDAVKPFAEVDIGRYRANSGDGLKASAAMGTEYAMGKNVTLTASVAYHKNYLDQLDIWVGKARLSYSPVKNVVTSVGFSWLEFGNIGYTGALAFRF